MRASIKKAEWSIKREEWYKKECEKILFETNSNLMKENLRIYIETNEEKILLLEMHNLKSQWYQIWQVLKEDK